MEFEPLFHLYSEDEFLFPEGVAATSGIMVTFARAECLVSPLRLQAAPHCREGMALPLVPPLVPSAAYVVRFLGS